MAMEPAVFGSAQESKTLSSYQNESTTGNTRCHLLLVAMLRSVGSTNDASPTELLKSRFKPYTQQPMGITAKQTLCG
jgi:hypothetical protein